MNRIKISGFKKNGKRLCLILRNETIDDRKLIAKYMKSLLQVTIENFN